MNARLKVTRDDVETAALLLADWQSVPGIHGALGTKITVTPSNHWCRRWVWKVELTRGGRTTFLCYAGGGSFRRPAPDTVQGRARGEGEAWAKARECVADVQRQIVALSHVVARTSTDEVTL